jgi:cytochrome c553
MEVFLPLMRGHGASALRSAPPPELPMAQLFASRMRFTSLAAVGLAFLAAMAVSPSAWAESPEFSAEQLEFFEKQVRPILAARCYECHGAEAEEPSGNLRVDSRLLLLEGGDTGPAIEPGNAKKSLLIDAINYGELYQMPPKSRLPADEIAILTKWVEQGAPWPAEEKPSVAAGKAFDLAARKAEHWSWRPLARPAVPEVKNSEWPRDDIDRFILARLEEQGFSPAEPAGKRTLLRRVYFDLIGLPPTPEQIDAFLADESPEALARVVDELLKSPHFGERWGRHWLDLARYAESRGHEFDSNAANAWQYRDYVIRALNSDLPYNRFVIEQVAGDLIPEPRLNGEQGFNESVLATGFWFLGEWVHSPVDIRKDEVDRYDNMIDVFSKTFLGLTVSCARCHDHKFDAISAKDYYALFGYLQSSAYRLVRFETMQEEERISRELEALNERFEPEIKEAIRKSQQESVRRIGDYLLASREVIVGKLEGEAIAKLAAKRKLDAERLAKWIAAIKAASDKADDLLHLWARYCEAGGDESLESLSSIATPIHEQRKARHEAFEKAIAESEMVVDYRQQDAFWLQNGVSFGCRPVAHGELLYSNDAEQPVAGFATLSAARRDPTWNVLRPGPGAEQEFGRLGNFDRAGKALRTPTFELNSGLLHYLVRGNGHAYAAVDSHTVIAGPLHGQIVLDFPSGDSSLRWISQDLRAYQGHRIHLEFSPAAEQPLEIVMVVQGDRQPPKPLAEALASSVTLPTTGTLHELSEVIQAELGESDVWLWEQRELVPVDESQTREVFARYAAERKKLTDQIKPESRYAMAMWDGDSQDELLMIRGSHRNMGPPVPRRMLEALAGSEGANIPHGSGRLQLAEELVDPAINPFVPRVMVNRVWHHLFGRGIVPSVDNFGVLGQEPTHVELLDHLATRLIDDGWSLKRLIRSIVLSRTYQMASTITDEAAEEADPKNLLWRRTNLRRLQAESIRDQILALSGRLDRTMYGPSVPVHLTPFMQGRGRPGDGPLDGNGRRSVYLSIRRNFLSPMMLAFDAPIPFSTMGARNMSNVPAQALILMNDPFVVQQAELWARRALAEPSRTPEERIRRLYVEAYGREATADELAAALEFLHSQAAEHGVPEASIPTDPRLWTDLVHVLMNAKEFVFIE